MSKKTKYLCIKEFPMADGKIAFYKGEVYEAIGYDFKSEMNPGRFEHGMTEKLIKEYFIEQNDEKQLLEEIFKFASGGYLEAGTYSDPKIRKSQKYAMEELILKFFPKQKEIAEARTTATEIAKNFEINEHVLDHLKSFAK